MNELLPWIILCFWAFGFWFLWRIPVPGEAGGPRSSAPSLSIVIPARNEERTIGLLLSSLTSRMEEGVEILVVDDQSEDKTAEIAAQHGVRTIRSTALPHGWAGKPWACLQGARAATGDFLLFLDADTVVAEGGLKRLLASCPQDGGVVTVQPFHNAKRAYERLAAVFNIIVLAGSNAFTPLGRRLRPAGAFGPCLLCKKEDYFRVGGHERVQGAILENLALGKVFLDAGYRVRCYGGKGVLSFRMYPDGFRAMVEGFTKGFVIGANAISWVSLLMIVCWVFGSISLTRHLVQSLVLSGGASSAVWFGLYVLYGLQFHWMLRRIGRFGAWPAILFPIPCLFFVVIFLISLFKTVCLRKARWKGRTVSTEGGKPRDHEAD